MVVKRVNYRVWFFQVLGWDGFLPAGLAIAPYLIHLIFPGRRGAVELAAVILPIAAFLTRMVVGSRHIGANHCGPVVRTIQYLVFYVGIFMLVLFDAFLVLVHIMPGGLQGVTPGDAAGLGFVVTVYLTFMTVAMYPGRVDVNVEDWDVAPDLWSD